MKTVILQKPGRFELVETQPDSHLASDEAWLRVHRIGICGTDFHAWRGKQPFFSYPRILGHELGVEVIRTGQNVSHVIPGDRCCVEPYRNTTNDHAVRRGLTNCGENISVLGVHEDGGMREYFKFPARYLHKSEKMSYDQLALVESLSIGCHAVNRGRVTAEDTVMVIGAGPIGLGAIRFARLAGAKVIAMDVNDLRLSFCGGVMNVYGTVNASAHDPESQIRDYFDGDLPTVVFDATGSAQSMMKSFEYIAHGGRLVFIGLFQGDITFHDPAFHKKELTLMSSRNSLGSEFKQIISLIEAGKIDTTQWISHRSSLQNVIDSFASWLEPRNGLIKAMVEV